MGAGGELPGTAGDPGAPGSPGAGPVGPGDLPEGGESAPNAMPGTATDPNDSSGNPDDPAGSAPDPGVDPDAPVTCSEETLTLGSSPMRRLSHTEYLNTLADLFPGIAPELPVLPVEAPVDSFDNDARALGASDVAVSRWEEIAYRYTSALTLERERLEATLPCAADVDDEGSASACGREFVTSFGEKTHRRPLAGDEEERYRALFDEQLAAIDFEAAVQLTAMAMLQSPWFLYRVEPAAAEAESTVALDSWQVASRLSYFLWQSMPDEALFDAARANHLTDPTEIEAEVRRMLEAPRARVALGDFYRQWLYFDRIALDEHQTRVPELFPDWTTETQAAAGEELLRFAQHSTFDGTGTLSDLLLSRETEVNGALAQLYDVEGPDDSDDWQAVTLPESERAGILTRVGFLAAHAHSRNGSPPLRGNYVMQRLFCMELPPPPPDADTSPPDVEGTALTNRESFEERTAPDTCQACHTVLDSFGFGFEHYDAVGAYRDEDNGQPVDAVVTLTGTDVGGEVNGAIELSERLAQSEQVHQCVVSRWYRYAVGRGVEARDSCALEPLEQRFSNSGGNFVELLVDIATSPEFRHRAVEQE